MDQNLVPYVDQPKQRARVNVDPAEARTKHFVFRSVFLVAAIDGEIVDVERDTQRPNIWRKLRNFLVRRKMRWMVSATPAKNPPTPSHPPKIGTDPKKKKN